jgi:hypothetical protein
MLEYELAFIFLLVNGSEEIVFVENEIGNKINLKDLPLTSLLTKSTLRFAKYFSGAPLASG